MDILVLQEIADHIPGIIFAKTRDGKFIYANRGYERLFQVKREELIGKTNADFMPEEVAASVRANDLIVLENGVSQRFDEEIPVKGETRTYSCIKFPLRDESGAVYGVAGISTDITDSKRDEEALKEANARLQALVNAIPDMILFKDVEGRHLLANEAAEHFMGMPGGEVLGKTNEEILPPEVAAMCTASDRQALADGGPVRADESAPSETGEPVCLDTIKAPIHDERGELMGLVVVSRDITGRKRQEEALRASEARFRDVFANVPVGMFITDPEGKFLHVNKSLSRFLGYGKEELPRSRVTFKELTHPDDLKENLRVFHRLMAGEIRDFTFEKRYVRKDGKTVWGRVSASSRIENGEVRYIGIVEDIDDRKRAEEAVRQSEERFRMFADFTYDWEYWISPEDHYVYVSPACEKITGYGPEHFRDSRQLLEMIHPEDRELFAGHLEKHLKESTRFSELEFRIVDRQGEERWLAHACQPVYGKDGRYMGRRASNRDITARKAAEQQMKLFVDLLDQSNDAISVIDLATGRITLVNEKLCQNLQYTREELLAMRPEDVSVKPPGYFDRHFRELQKVGSFLAEDYHRRKDGTIFPVEVNVKHTKVDDREFAVAAIRDISERRRLEQELQKTQKLESIGLLAGGIAHDFNNILTAILGNITLARMFMPPGEKAADRLAVAEQASMRARGLAQQLLTFAKGGAPIRETIAVPELVREAVSLSLRGSAVKEEYSFTADLPPVEADGSQLNQAISNLALNAVEAMPEGGILNAAAANTAVPPENSLGLPAGKYVRIVVKDQGGGIPPEAQEKIFDPYFTTKEGGSGLGLAISFSIAKRHGGTIIVDSAPGKGSTFSIYLPASKRKIVAPRAEEPREPVPGTGRILVMDDEEAVNEVAAEMLRHLGYRTETARDGAEAVAAYRQALAAGEPFDAVVTDLTVPGGMGGKETVQRLLEIDPQAKVIVSSGYGNDPIMSDYLEYGFKGVIPKPYRLADLSRALQEVLGGRKGKN